MPTRNVHSQVKQAAILRFYQKRTEPLPLLPPNGGDGGWDLPSLLPPPPKILYGFLPGNPTGSRSPQNPCFLSALEYALPLSLSSSVFVIPPLISVIDFQLLRAELGLVARNGDLCTARAATSVTVLETNSRSPLSAKKNEKPIIVIDNYDSFTYNLCQEPQTLVGVQVPLLGVFCCENYLGLRFHSRSFEGMRMSSAPTQAVWLI
ncbi:hypothetical protein CRG98_014323 [Punica granatum]|uniref:Glutamine amidotransferase domain-containing protein n=1 Tax=Punica granatum TaxID=22663 RepID=A0A2I0K9R3_PUNGR|nr:hypothetical protein CRG98_014323 [Punica granatum]